MDNNADWVDVSAPAPLTPVGQAIAPAASEADWTDIKPPAETALHQESGQVVQLPPALGGHESDYAVKTQVQGRDKSDFWGTVDMGLGFAKNLMNDPVKLVLATIPLPSAVKQPVTDILSGAAKGAVNEATTALPEMVSGAMLEGGERQDTASKQVVNFVDSLPVPQGAKDFIRDMYQSDEAKGVVEWNVAGADALHVANQDWAAKNGLTRPAGKAEGVAFDVGGAGAGTAAALGLTYLTGNPVYAGGLFGAMQKSDTYREARDKGMNPETAGHISTLMGVTNGVLQSVGTGIFVKLAAVDNGFQKVVLRAVDDALTMGAQTALGVGEAQATGLRDTSIHDALKDIGYSSAIGVAMGIGAGTIMHSAEKQAEQHGIAPETARAVAEATLAREPEVKEATSNILKQGNRGIATDPKAQAESAEIVKKFMAGEDVEPLITRSPVPADQNIAYARAPGAATANESLSPEERIAALREETAQKTDVSAINIKGRMDFLDRSVSNIDAQMESLEQRLADRQQNTQPTKAVENALERLGRQRDTLDEERGHILTDNAHVNDTLVQPTRVEVKAKQITKLAKQSDIERQRALENGLREGRRLAQSDVKKGQETIINTLEESSLGAEDKAKFIRAIKNIQTTDQAARELPAIQSRIARLAELAQVRSLKNKIINTLKKTAPKRQNSKLKSKYTADVQDMLDELRTMAKLKPTEAEAKLSERLANNETPEPLDAVKNQILQAIAGAKGIHSADLADAFNTVQELVGEGKAGFLEKALASKEQLAKDVEEAVTTMAKLPQTKRAEARNPGIGGSLFNKLGAKFFNGKGALRSGDSSLLKLETMFKWAADRDPHNVILKQIDKLHDAGGKETNLRQDILGKFNDIIQGASKETRRDFNKIYTIPELIDSKTGKPSVLAKSQLLHIALHMGTESNMEKLLEGEGWKQEDVEKVLNKHLTASDWKFVQDIWKNIGSLWPMIEDLERRTYGVTPQKIEGREITTPYGTFQGDYVPIVYDPSRGARAADVVQTDNLRSDYVRPSTAKGHTIARTTYNAPLLLDLQVIPRHLEQVIHDLAFREPVAEVSRFTGNKDFRDAFEKALGHEYYNQIRPWLNAVAGDKTYDSKGLAFWDKLAHTARENSTMVGIGYRLSTVAKHGLTALSNSFTELGPRWMTSGIRSVYGNPIKIGQAKDFIFERSPYMKQRLESNERDLRDMFSNMELKSLESPHSALRNAYDAIKRYGGYSVGVSDMASALPTWMGAYNRALHNGEGEEDAIHQADRVVRDAHGSGAVVDQAAFQRGTETWKLASMFYSFFNHIYNQQRDAIRMGHTGAFKIGQGDVKAGSYDFANALAKGFGYWIIPALVEHMVAAAGSDKEDEGFGLGEIAAATLSGIPVLRDIANAAVHGRDYNFTPVEEMVRSIIKSGKDIVGTISGDGPSDKWLKNAIQNLGYISGLPTGQASTAIPYIWDVMHGDASPESLSDWYKGISGHG